MTWTEALDWLDLRQHPHVWRYRELCADDRPDHEAWRGFVVTLAGQWPPLRSVDEVLAEAKAEGIPERIEPRTGCCGGSP